MQDFDVRGVGGSGAEQGRAGQQPGGKGLLAHAVSKVGAP
jgi:hypothetical protein